jgi:putative CocE/NonD family hydrolase
MGAVAEKDAPGNVWREAKDWPIIAPTTSYYLHANGKLNAERPTADSGAAEIKADPTSPAKIPAGGFPGGKDARDFEKQENVLTFTTDVIEEPVEWTGRVAAEVWIKSSAKDTDVIVRISDVYPDGRSILIMDYVRRARYREGYAKEVFLEPGKVAKIAFDVGNLSQIFNKGHRIRVTVACTGAPFYEINPNTGEPLTIEPPANTVVATNAIQINRLNASRIIAPVRVVVPQKRQP